MQELKHWKHAQARTAQAAWPRDLHKYMLEQNNTVHHITLTGRLYDVKRERRREILHACMQIAGSDLISGSRGARLRLYNVKRELTQ